MSVKGMARKWPRGTFACHSLRRLLEAVIQGQFGEASRSCDMGMLLRWWRSICCFENMVETRGTNNYALTCCPTSDLDSLIIIRYI